MSISPQYRFSRQSHHLGQRSEATLWQRIHIDPWLTLLLLTVCCIGLTILYSASTQNTSMVLRQVVSYGVAFVVMFTMAQIPPSVYRTLTPVFYMLGLILLVLVDIIGEVRMGAQRWIELGSFRLQPSELMKITLVMMLAAYYDWLPPKKTSRPLWVLLPVLMILIPTALVLKQPDLGTAILLMAAGGGLMFLAGVHWGYFAVVIAGAVGLVSAVFQSRGTPWQLIKDYQFRRIDTFIDPSTDPLGAGYHITQSKIALGSGGWTGRGFMQGTQSRLNFLPEKHTDFIFTTLAEEFGFVGGFSLLGLYALIIVFCVAAALINKDRFSSLLTLGIALNFFCSLR